MKLYLATGNAHKVGEFRELFASEKLTIDVAAADQLGGMPRVEEDASTFAGNAEKKARALAARAPSGSWVLADDSGLCVDFLGGAPGVRSARYAGADASDGANAAKLLRVLAGVAAVQRTAAFHCHLCLIDSAGIAHRFDGACRGRILENPSGGGGFGYDPVFVPEGYDQTFAELSGTEKNRISHRGRALQALVIWLRANADVGEPGTR